MMIGVTPATDAALSYNAWWMIGVVLIVGVAIAAHNHWMHRKLRQHVTDMANK